VYVFHVSKANREETLHGKILEEGARHYKILLDYPWQDSNRTRTVFKSDLKGNPVIELRSDREARLQKGWKDFYESRAEVNIGTIDDPKPVPKQAFELANRARELAKTAEETYAATFRAIPISYDKLETAQSSNATSSKTIPPGTRRLLAVVIIVAMIIAIALIARTFVSEESSQTQS